ncbi:MAG TPA: disulfide bond formation protein DsbD, partial [Fibrella sp.]
MNRFIAPLGLLLCLFTAVTTGFGQFGQNNITKPTTFVYSVSPAKAKVGDIVELRITARSKEGWHMYAAKTNPKLEMGPQATALTLVKNKTFELSGQLVSVGYETKFDDVWEGDTYIMPNPAVFTQKLKLLSEKPILKGTIEGQACSDVCVQVSDDFDVSAEVLVAAAATPESVTAATVSTPTSTTIVSAADVPESASAILVSADTVRASGTSVAPAVGEVDPLARSAAEQSGSQSLWGFALAAFLSGLAALLTPCVFPIIPMTVSFFTHQKGGWWKALIYGAS